MDEHLAEAENGAAAAVLGDGICTAANWSGAAEWRQDSLTTRYEGQGAAAAQVRMGQKQ